MKIINRKTVHFVFNQRNSELEAEISLDYKITGWTKTLADTRLWSKAQGESVSKLSNSNLKPDIVLINGLDHYRQIWKNKSNPDKVLMELLIEIIQNLKSSRLKIILPEAKNLDQNLLIDLMQNGVYDFWFFDEININIALLKDILNLDRSFADLEQYLQTLPTPQIQLVESNKSNNELVENYSLSVKNTFNKLISFNPIDIKKDIMKKVLPIKEDYPFIEVVNENKSQPIKSISSNTQRQQQSKLPIINAGTALFWSEDDCLLSYATTFLMAYFLANKGYKTIIFELPSLVPRLGSALGIRHPTWNVFNALSQFINGQEAFYQQCIFNSKKYCNNEFAYDQHSFLKNYPDNLYFFPDSADDDWKVHDELKLQWESFLINWVQWAMFNQRFQYIFYIGFGHSFYQDVVFNKMSYMKVLMLQPWSNGFNKALETEANCSNQNLYIWSHDSPILEQETKEIDKAKKINTPLTVYQDFINISSFKHPPSQLQEETRLFIETIGQHFLTDFRLPNQKKGLKAWLITDLLRKKGD